MRRPALSPSRAGDFKQCPLLYRFRAVDRLPEKPTKAQVRGTVIDAMYFGAFSRLRVDCSGAPLAVDLSPEQHPLLPAPGTRVGLQWAADAVHPLGTA